MSVFVIGQKIRHAKPILHYLLFFYYNLFEHINLLLISLIATCFNKIFNKIEFSEIILWNGIYSIWKLS